MAIADNDSPRIHDIFRQQFNDQLTILQRLHRTPLEIGLWKAGARWAFRMTQGFAGIGAGFAQDATTDGSPASDTPQGNPGQPRA